MSEIRTLNWNRCLSPFRRKKGAPATGGSDARSPFERDYDRVLFSAPVRRLADKTQVFPLEPNDSIRTRLTHSHEVSTLARALGNALVRSKPEFLDGVDNADEIPTILATVGLAHDLGNPPFGHQGEEAIGEWVCNNKDNNESFADAFAELSEAQQEDFLKFEGNAQCFRLLTRLQLKNDGYGLDLTSATLTALVKYPVSSARRDSKVAVRKKHGFFVADRATMDEVWGHTGLGEGIRHPLAYLMEAADDIAYSVIDVEDAVKKGLVSFPDVMTALRQASDGNDSVIETVLARSEKDHRKYQKLGLSPGELNELTMQKFRVHAMTAMIPACVDSFIEHHDAIASGEMETDLLTAGTANMLCKSLKRFAFRHAYRHRSVLELELKGRATIHYLMDVLWRAIAKNEEEHDSELHYIYSRVSENYRRVYEAEVKRGKLPVLYCRLMLLTDMIAGMTDGFAVNLQAEFKEMGL